MLYIGAEYCPFCAAERWSLILALDKFGTFTGIEYLQSAPSPEAYPNTPTFTFRNATYTSSYISFVSVEQTDSNHNALQTLSTNQSAVMNAYDSTGSIPFLDIGNRYVQVGTQYTPATFANANWTQIASQLDSPSSNFAMKIDGAANRLIAAICKVDGNLPATVCSQPLAHTLGYLRNHRANGLQPLIAADLVSRASAVSSSPVRAGPRTLSTS